MAHVVTRLIVIRHGETAWNREIRIQGQMDIGLNEHGRWQAARVGLALRDESVDAVYSSDLRRAWDTASEIGRACSLPVEADPCLRERHFGRFQGLTHDEITRQWPEEARRWRGRDPAYGPEGGETLFDFNERVVSAAARIALRHPEQTVVLVAHGGVLDCFYRSATHVGLTTPRSWSVANANINRLIHSEEGFGLVGWADGRHLDDDGLEEMSDGAVTPPGLSPLPYS